MATYIEAVHFVHKAAVTRDLVFQCGGLPLKKVCKTSDRIVGKLEMHPSQND